MESDMQTKLTAIVNRALFYKPDAIDFAAQVDTKSFWSQTFKATLTWKNEVEMNRNDSQGRLMYPERVFIKLPIIGSIVRERNADTIKELKETLKRLTETEVDFYEMFGNTDMGLFRTPNIYLAEKIVEDGSGCFVFEDMSLSDGGVFSEEYIPGFSVDQANKLMHALAAFHHHLYTSENKEWLKKFGSPVDEEFQEYQYDCVKQFETFDPTRFQGKIADIESTFLGGLGNETRANYGFEPVLVHQDLNPTNILWKISNAAKEISAIIDFQMVTVGSFAEDIVRILSLGLSTETRRKYWKSILSQYYLKLVELFDGNAPIALKQIEEEYLRVFPFVCNFTLFGISCYYAQCKEQKLPSDVKHHLLTEYLKRAEGLIDDIILLRNI